MSKFKETMAEDLKMVRTELKEVLTEVKERKTTLKRANVIIYACSNITRTIVTEIYLNQNYKNK